MYNMIKINHKNNVHSFLECSTTTLFLSKILGLKYFIKEFHTIICSGSAVHFILTQES